MADSVISTQTQGKKVAIVGFTASNTEAPWGESGWELWVCNNLWRFVPNSWHRIYDLHDIDSDRPKDPEHEAFLRGTPQKGHDGKPIKLGDREVWCFRPRPEWPTARTFPREEINDKLGRYFTNSISWMIAHALMEGATELSIYGVDMATGGEYAAQRPSCEYMLGIAVGMGVKVYVSPQSDLLKLSAMYGVEDDSALYAKIKERKTELTQRANALQQQISKAQTQLAQVQGALEATAYFGDVWCNPRATARHDKQEDDQASNHDGKSEELNMKTAIERAQPKEKAVA